MATIAPSPAAGAPPSLPSRNSAARPPPARPGLCQARALYHYAASDSRDCSLEKDDTVVVLEYMNADWWMGRNVRTGQEGIFPKSYVEVQQPADSASAYTDEKAGAVSAYPLPPRQQNPYNANVPPHGRGPPQRRRRRAGQGLRDGEEVWQEAGQRSVPLPSILQPSQCW